MYFLWFPSKQNPNLDMQTSHYGLNMLWYLIHNNNAFYVTTATDHKGRKTLENIAFASGGAHLPIAHALRLLSTQELQFGLTKLKLILAGKFFKKGGAIFLKLFKSIFLFLDEIEIEKK